jgi:cell wall-associated NlpC family hydrolase
MMNLFKKRGKLKWLGIPIVLLILAFLAAGVLLLFTVVGLTHNVSSSQSSNSNSNCGPSELTGNANSEQVWNWFKGAGYPAPQIAAIMGNLGWESGGTFDPNIKQSGGGPGRGIAQWSVGGRWDELVLFTASIHLPPTSLEGQLRFVLHEMQSGSYGDYKITFMSMNMLDATAYFERNYEAAGIPHMDKRIEYAQQYYNQYANTTTAAASAQPVPVSASIPVTGQCVGGNASDQAKTVIQYAEQFLGVPYVWGGADPSGFDCSGLMQYSFKNALGITLPRTAAEQQQVGTRISPDQVQPGDLVFMGMPAYHVGMYIGNGQWIEAPETGDVVKIAKYNPSSFDTATRILQ